jgi:hypothetical protein
VYNASAAAPAVLSFRVGVQPAVLGDAGSTTRTAFLAGVETDLSEALGVHAARFTNIAALPLPNVRSRSMRANAGVPVLFIVIILVLFAECDGCVTHHHSVNRLITHLIFTTGSGKSNAITLRFNALSYSTSVSAVIYGQVG